MVVKAGMIFMTRVRPFHTGTYIYIVDWVTDLDVGYHNVGLKTGTSLELRDFKRNFTRERFGKWMTLNKKETKLATLLYGDSHEEDE